MIQKKQYFSFLIFILLIITNPVKSAFAQDVELLNPSEGFSPNNDGINDYWYIKNIENYPTNVVFIYNLWGTQVTEIVNYTNENNNFNGLVIDHVTGDNITLPFGTYFFLIKIPNTKTIDGYVVLAR